jgi:hypothetical protein
MLLDTRQKEHADQKKLIRNNRRFAQRTWGNLPFSALFSLDELGRNYQFSVVSGDLIFLNSAWYVTHMALVRLARRHRCAGIQIQLLPRFCDAASARWVFKATVYTRLGSKGFAGHGDADRSNVSAVVRGAEMRVAETRAVNRALRKAYGIGICSVEEIGSSAESRPARKMPPQSANGNGNYGGPKVRDRLCQLIRQHGLDAGLVKSYAVDFCGTKQLREATREQVEAFVAHLSDWAEKDRNALLCQLNSYLPPQSKQEGAA